jgi:hypothetical protein
MLKVFRFENGTATEIAAAPETINVPSTSLRTSRNGCATFALCSPDYGVFVSNRLVNGKDFDNDLYELRNTPSGWFVRRLDGLSSLWWDDTPALSPDGRLLFFSSNRNGHARGTTDLFVSQWRDSHWSEPVLLNISTEEWNEQSPFAAIDGYLYYATDRDGDFDIWRVRYDPATGQAIDEPQPVPFPGVNQRGSDEGHPAVPDRGTVFLFSSNRSARRDFDIYKFEMPEQLRDSLTVTAVIRSREVDWVTGIVEDQLNVYPNRPVHVRSLLTGETLTVTTDSTGIARLPLPKRPLESWVVSVEPHSPRYVSSYDTLLIGSACTEPLVHTIVVWDTATIVSPECVQDFPVKNVRFFVTGYWCPTTQRYASWLSCTPLLVLDSCKVVSYQQPRLACDENEVFSYSLVFTPPRVEPFRKEGSACIDMAEARTKGPQFAIEVDAAIDRIINSMGSALQAPCLLRSVSQGNMVTITVTGWTDPRPLDRSCLYTGPTLPTRTGIVRLDTQDSPYIEGESLQGDGKIAFVRSKAGGNYLLSQLRAYYTALMLDRLWEDEIPAYAELKARGQIEVIALGKAISQENRDYSERRSIEVRVSVPMPEQRIVKGQVPTPGSLVKFCQLECVQH